MHYIDQINTPLAASNPVFVDLQDQSLAKEAQPVFILLAAFHDNYGHTPIHHIGI